MYYIMAHIPLSWEHIKNEMGFLQLLLAKKELESNPLFIKAEKYVCLQCIHNGKITMVPFVTRIGVPRTVNSIYPNTVTRCG